MSTKFMYLRSTRDQMPVGCAAYTIDRETGELAYQVSVVNPKPTEVNGKVEFDRFDRALSRKMAEEYLAARPILVKTKEMIDVKAQKIADLDQAITEAGANERLANKLGYRADLLEAEKIAMENSATACLMSALASDNKIPSRANKTAKNWLRRNVLGL